MIYTVKHFRPEEFKCKCCGRGGVSPLLVFYLDILRRSWGEPITVNSGYRCEKHNLEVGGARKSRHLIGCAVDLSVKNKMDFFCYACDRIFDMPGWEHINGLKKHSPKRYFHVGCPRMVYSPVWSGGRIEIFVNNYADLLSEHVLEAVGDPKVVDVREIPL